MSAGSRWAAAAVRLLGTMAAALAAVVLLGTAASASGAETSTVVMAPAQLVVLDRDQFVTLLWFLGIPVLLSLASFVVAYTRPWRT